MVGELGSRKTWRLGIAGASRVEYSPAGFLLFARENTLMAQPFDARRRRVTGEPFPVVEPVGTEGNGLAHFSVSDQGGLIYRTGGSANNRLQWLDRAGRPLADAVGQPANDLNLALSPDGRRIALRRIDSQTANRDIWVLEPARGTATRFTFDAANENTPVWSPDGSRIAFTSNRGGGSANLYWKLASGAGAEELLLSTGGNKFFTDWSADGRFIAYFELDPKSQFDLWVLPTSGDRKPILFLQTSFNEQMARFSPDGRWMAYSSDESGRFEVYVQSFPGPGGKWQVSTQGGDEPTWRGDGQELFYLGPDQKLMAVEVRAGAGATFEAGVPTPLFDPRVAPGGWTHYAVARDGQRFLAVSPEAAAAFAPTTVVLDWTAEMGRK